ncbi:MAG: PHP domain-containing protein [Candidatus Hydrogenedentes bacterium]|nr:PHP domain-containing protein [Candidatus Hydrogenedentota bacterium]
MNTDTFVDLHLHTRHSDGSDSPAVVVARAVAAGASAIALTDHATVAVVAAGRVAARNAGLGFLSGTEISTGFKGREVHVLGLGIDIENEALCAALGALCHARQRRGRDILERLAELDIHLPESLVADGGEAFGRMHIARAMTDAGYVKKPQEAFDRYLNGGKAAFVPKKTLPVAEAVDCIHGAGGLAFVAHPGLGKTVRKLLPELLLLPFDGIEAYHISHTPGRVDEFLVLAGDRGLLVSGGSDCHGTIKGKALLGRVRTPRAVYEAIVKQIGGGS